jgi:hypothetical protein
MSLNSAHPAWFTDSPGLSFRIDKTQTVAWPMMTGGSTAEKMSRGSKKILLWDVLSDGEQK